MQNEYENPRNWWFVDVVDVVPLRFEPFRGSSCEFSKEVFLQQLLSCDAQICFFRLRQAFAKASLHGTDVLQEQAYGMVLVDDLVYREQW